MAANSADWPGAGAGVGARLRPEVLGADGAFGALGGGGGAYTWRHPSKKQTFQQYSKAGDGPSRVEEVEARVWQWVAQH